MVVNCGFEGVDDLTCAITSTSSDDDGDTIGYTYNWYDPNGNNSQIVPNTNSLTDTFPGSSTTSGLWECEVVASDGSLSNSGTGDIEVEADWPGTLDFTNCNQTGLSGPSQSQCDSDYSGTTLDGIITVASGVQTFIIPSDGTYSIEVAGAKGGDVVGYSRIGGYGATISGEFTLSAGTVINIVVGQMGSDEQQTGYGGGGGGGGSFVYTGSISGNGLLIAAGGGAGVCEDDACDGPGGQTGNNSNNNC